MYIENYTFINNKNVVILCVILNLYFTWEFKSCANRFFNQINVEWNKNLNKSIPCLYNKNRIPNSIFNPFEFQAALIDESLRNFCNKIIHRIRVKRGGAVLGTKH